MQNLYQERRSSRNNIDSGLDLTPVRDSIKARTLEANEIKSFQQRVNNLNIKPTQQIASQEKNNYLINKRNNNKNPNSSDTDSSIQVKCCANPFKWYFLR